MSHQTNVDSHWLDKAVAADDGAMPERWWSRWEIWFRIFVVLAIAVRCVRYVVRFPLWEDECFVGVSIYQRDFLGLLQPLEYHQVAPFLFLWLEKAVVSILGFNELALRLPAFVCSLASLALFAHLLRRLAAGAGAVFAMALFAVSYPATRYAAEAKPYGTDLFVSLALIVLFVEWMRRPTQTRWLVGLVFAAPVAIGLSLPALFTTAALGVLAAGVMVRQRLARRWSLWFAYCVSVSSGAAALYVLSIRPQMQAELGFMSEQWANAFVPFNSIGTLLKWIFTTHTGILFAHPIGDKNFGSTLTTILLVAGLVSLIRRGRWTVALLLLLPLGLHLSAAVLQRYPYGGHVKFSMYAAAMIYVVMGVGASAVLEWSRSLRSSGTRRSPPVFVLLLIGVIGVGSVISDVITPYKTTADARQRALAMWLWHDGNFEDRTVCIKDDLGYSFSTRTWHDLGWSAMYLCNKYVYAPKHLVREPRPSYAAAPTRHYLRCVLYRDLGKGDFQQDAFDRWLAEMKLRHAFIDVERFPLPRHDTRNRRIVTIDYIEIYRFQLNGTD